AFLVRELGVGEGQEEIGVVEPVPLLAVDRLEAAEPFRAQAEGPLLEAAVEQQLALGEGKDAGVELDAIGAVPAGQQRELASVDVAVHAGMSTPAPLTNP